MVDRYSTDLCRGGATFFGSVVWSYPWDVFKIFNIFLVCLFEFGGYPLYVRHVLYISLLKKLQLAADSSAPSLGQTSEKKRKGWVLVFGFRIFGTVLMFGDLIAIGPFIFLVFPTVYGRNIQTHSFRYNPLAPKVQYQCNLKCVSPNGRKKSNP